MGQAVGAALQLGVVQGHATTDQGDGVRRRLCLGSQQFGQQGLGRLRRLAAPLVQLPLLVGIEQRQVADGAFGALADLLQQAHEVCGEALDAGALE